jgi:hypothetical protein
MGRPRYPGGIQSAYPISAHRLGPLVSLHGFLGVQTWASSVFLRSRAMYTALICSAPSPLSLTVNFSAYIYLFISFSVSLFLSLCVSPCVMRSYFGEIDRISTAGYVASEQDLLRSRVRTSGIVEEAYIIDSLPFVYATLSYLCIRSSCRASHSALVTHLLPTTTRIYDVGGQRNERRKWIHCFDDVTAVIFVAAISEYDQVWSLF